MAHAKAMKLEHSETARKLIYNYLALIRAWTI